MYMQNIKEFLRQSKMFVEAMTSTGLELGNANP